MRKPITTLVAVTLALVAGLTVAHASGPIGVYSLIDKVSFEPGSDDPAKAERIRIDGVFIVADGKDTNTYSQPQRGFLYFALPANNPDLARREWADLKSLAGTHQVVGFGSSWFTQAVVNKPDVQPKNATPYPMGNGLVKLNPDQQPRAKALLEYKGTQAH